MSEDVLSRSGASTRCNTRYAHASQLWRDIGLSRRTHASREARDGQGYGEPEPPGHEHRRPAHRGVRRQHERKGNTDGDAGSDPDRGADAGRPDRDADAGTDGHPCPDTHADRRPDAHPCPDGRPDSHPGPKPGRLACSSGPAFGGRRAVRGCHLDGDTFRRHRPGGLPGLHRWRQVAPAEERHAAGGLGAGGRSRGRRRRGSAQRPTRELVLARRAEVDRAPEGLPRAASWDRLGRGHRRGGQGRRLAGRRTPGPCVPVRLRRRPRSVPMCGPRRTVPAGRGSRTRRR